LSPQKSKTSEANRHASVSESGQTETPSALNLSTAAGNIIQILANLPDFMRKPMLKSRLAEFYSMEPALRRETIKMALDAAPSVDTAKLAVLLRTWLELLAEFDSERRSTMFHIYCQEIANLEPWQIQKLDLQSIANVFLSVPEQKRQVLTDSIHEVLLSVPNRERILKLAPFYLLSALKLR
jgi:hypothetical protein